MQLRLKKLLKLCQLRNFEPKFAKKVSHSEPQLKTQLLIKKMIGEHHPCKTPSMINCPSMPYRSHYIKIDNQIVFLN